jgi:hypothetical protein
MKNQEMPQINPERAQEYYNALADKLEALQAPENNNNGIECVRALIFYLRKGMIPAAKAKCFNDIDKFDFWKDISEIIKNELFEPGEINPWTI